MVPDKIEKQVLLRAPLPRVWRAISDSERFGAWFGARIDGPFVPGRTLRCVVVPTQVDPEIARLQAAHEGTVFEIAVERLEPERALAFRWYPLEFESGIDLSTAPMTLVTFELEERAEGVLMTMTESGFDRVPLAGRARAFEQNEAGWAMQARLIERYLAAEG